MYQKNKRSIVKKYVRQFEARGCAKSEVDPWRPLSIDGFVAVLLVILMGGLIGAVIVICERCIARCDYGNLPASDSLLETQ